MNINQNHNKQIPLSARQKKKSMVIRPLHKIRVLKKQQ